MPSVTKPGPVSFYTEELVGYARIAFKPVPDESKVRSTLKAVAITAAEGLHSLVQLVESAVSFIIEKIKAVAGSKQVQEIKKEWIPYVKEKATAAKDFVVGKANALYGKLSSFRQPKAI